jgi:hypothetical protein
MESEWALLEGTIQGQKIQQRQLRFGRMDGEWRRLRGEARFETVQQWKVDFEAMAASQAAAERDDRWITGPSDLMKVLGREGDELSHSAVVAWLLDPTRPHRLGRRLLAALASRQWPSTPHDGLDGSVLVEREIWDVLDTTTRADVLVWIGEEALWVIENKVFSDEGIDQCQRLYDRWAGQREDVRFILLSRSGEPPNSVRSEEARTAWTPLSYRDLVQILDELRSQAQPRDGIAESTVAQYIESVRRYLI